VTTDQHASNSMAVRERALYADSGWRLAHGERFDVFDPTNERVIASIPAGSEADVDEVLASAQRAQAGWARTMSA
jgi:aldehyde dehydrogenase (NAD+)